MQPRISGAHAGSWGSGSAVSAPAVLRVMGGTPERNENSKKDRFKYYIWGGFFYFKCCQPKVHWYDMYTDICELCFIPMNVHDSTVQWCSSLCSSAQMAAPFAYSQLWACDSVISFVTILIKYTSEANNWIKELLVFYINPGEWDNTNVVISRILKPWTHHMTTAQHCAMLSATTQFSICAQKS